MNYVALALVILIVAGICYAPRLLPRLHVWRRCRCGTRYCTGCGRREQ